jgi:hypothetical protein
MPSGRPGRIYYSYEGYLYNLQPYVSRYSNSLVHLLRGGKRSAILPEARKEFNKQHTNQSNSTVWQSSEEPVTGILPDWDPNTGKDKPVWNFIGICS